MSRKCWKNVLQFGVELSKDNEYLSSFYLLMMMLHAGKGLGETDAMEIHPYLLLENYFEI